MTTNLGGLLPTTALAPYTTSFSLLAAPAQNLQQFPQSVSNAPGQTVDYFFNVLSVLLNLSQEIQNSSTGSVNTFATEAVGILTAIIDNVQTAFAKEYQWSSPILPYKGWAANNCVQSATNPLNVSGIASTLTGATDSSGSVAALTYILYYYLYAFNTEVKNLSIQINQYTYAHLVTNTPPFSYNGSPVQSVAEWINYLFSQLIVQMPTSFFDATQSAFPLIEASIFNNVLTATVETLEHIPLYFLTYPQGPSTSNSSTYTTLTAEVSNILLIIFIGLLYNTFSAITPALSKVDMLYDPKTHEYIFDTAASSIAAAFSAFASLAGPVNQTVTQTGANPGQNALTTKQFSYAITYTQKSSRTSSVDVNRIDGSLVPTLTRVLQLWNVVVALANEVLSPGSPTYNSEYINAVTALTTPAANTAVADNIQAAIDSFAAKGQLNIHYSRWSQNLTNI